MGLKRKGKEKNARKILLSYAKGTRRKKQQRNRGVNE